MPGATTSGGPPNPDDGYIANSAIRRVNMGWAGVVVGLAAGIGGGVWTLV